MNLKCISIEKLFVSIVAFAIAFISFTPQFQAAKPTYYSEDELIIKFKPGRDAGKVLSKHQGKKLHKKIDRLRLGKVKLPKGTDMKSEIEKLKKDPDIEYVQPNYLYQATLTPNDPDYSLQWGLPKIKADQAWDISTGNDSVTVAVIDTGVDSDHPDLAASLVPGYNAITNTSNSNDDNGHGTHVAGITAGVIGNGKGIAGVSGKSRIMPIKVLNSSGSGYTSDICEGIYWAVDHGARVINMSLGGPYFDQASQDAVNYAYSKGVIVIAAAGNDNTSSPSYPAALNHVVAVSATDQNNSKAWFSNYGNYVDIAAPGVNIYSSTFDGSYGYKSGTSMASPFVAGVAALLLSQDNAMTPDQVEKLMSDTAVDIGASGKDSYFGFGLVDTFAAIKLVTPPSSLPAKGNIDKPGGLETITGTYTVKGWFLDGNIVSKLEVLVDGNVIGEAIYGDPRPDIGSIFPEYNNDNCGFHYELDSTQLTSGDHSLTVRETAKNGVQTTLNGRPIIVANNLPPVGAIEKPGGLETINGAYTVKGWFLDENTVSRIEVLVDGEVMGEAVYGDPRPDIASKYPKYNNTNCGFHFDLNTVMLSNGSHKINIRETAKTGIQKALTDIPVTVSNTASLPPQGSIESPQWFELVSGTYRVKGWFLDGNTVSKIEILVDGEVMGTAVYGDPRPDIYQTYPGYKNSNAGFHYDLNTENLTEGDHTITIRETSSKGEQKTLTGPLVTVLKTIVPKKSKAVTIYYTLSEASSVTITIHDSLNNLVRTLESNARKNAGLNSTTWDGKNSSGAFVPDGIYTYKISAVDLAGLPASPITGTITVERLNPSITEVSDNPDPFIPDQSESSIIKFTLSENANVTLKVYNSSNNLISTLENGSASIGGNSSRWNGTDNSGNLVTSGTYTYRIDAADAFLKKAAPVSGTIMVDGTPPEIENISISPNPFAPLGSNRASICFELSESSKVTVGIYDSNDALVRTLENSSLKPAGTNTINWDGRDTSGTVVRDGIYTYKISAVDLVGLTTGPVTEEFTVEGSSPSITMVGHTPDPFIPGDSKTFTINYTLSENADVSIIVYDSTNNPVKTLVDGAADPGGNTAVWDGTNSSVPDSSIYTYKINATDAFNKTAPQVSRTILVDAQPPAVSNASISPNPFEPAGSNTAAITYDLSENAQVTVSIFDSLNTLVKTLEENAYKAPGSNSVLWDGRNSNDAIVGDGSYSYRISAVDPAGHQSQPVTGPITVERNAPAITTVSDSPDPFTPDGIKVSTIKYSLSEDAQMLIEVYNADSLVKTLVNASVQAGTHQIVWNGTDNTGALTGSGIYTYRMNAVDKSGKKAGQVSGTITIDLTPPVIGSNMVSVSSFSPVNGETAAIFYNLSENARVTVSIYDASGKLIKTLENNALKSTGANSAIWEGDNSSDSLVKNGTYTYKISAVDMSGLKAQPATGTIAVTGTDPIIAFASDNPDPFSPNGKNVCTIKYTLAKTIKLSLKIYDNTGSLVRTLANTSVSSGTRSNTWDGRNSAGQLVKSGIYTYKLTAYSAGNKVVDQVTGIITVDLTPPVISDNLASPDPYAPLGENKASVSFVLSEPAKTSISIYDPLNTVVKTLESNYTRMSGTNTANWDGKDSSGFIVKDGLYTYKITAVDTAGLSASPVTGTIKIEHVNPAVTSLTDSPDPFKPDNSSVSKIGFALSENADVTLKIYDNRNSLVKTLINGSMNAGANSVSWDGKNQSGLLVTSGTYTYKIDAVNSFNKMAEQASGTITVDLAPPSITQYSVSPDVFAPTGKNKAVISYNLSESAKVIVAVFNSSNALIKTLESDTLKNAGPNWIEWDGKDSSGNIVKDASYTYKISAVDLVGFTAAPVSGTIRVESELTVTSVSDQPDPFRSIGSNTAGIGFTLSRNANVAVKIYDSNNILITTLGNTGFAAGDCLLTWNGNNSKGVRAASGVYTYRIEAVDSLGRKAAPASGTITIDLAPPVIGSHSISPTEFIPSGSNTAVITYNLSENAYVTTTIYNSSNTPVRTLESTTLKTAGSNSVSWDGKDSSGVIIEEGVYTYRITAVDFVNLQASPASGTIIVGAGPSLTSVSDSPDPFRPTDTDTSVIKYSLSKKAVVTIRIYDSKNNLIKTLLNEPVAPGDNSIAWNGKDDMGNLAAGGTYTYRVNAVDALGRKAGEVSGTITVDLTAPVISEHSASPNPFTPKE